MKVFVTGSTGLLGNNLVRQLLERGDQVLCLVRSEEKGKRQLGDTAAELIKGDMLDVPGFADRLEGCEAVYHTAAYFREYFQPGDHSASIEAVNIQGLLNLLAAAQERGVKRFIQVSSSGAIGIKPDGSPGDESTPPVPLQIENLYFRSKVEGDKKIAAWQAEHTMEVVEILPGWMWGPGDAAPTAAGQLALDFMNKKIPGIVDGGACLVDARDVAAAMIAACEKGRAGERYLVAGEFHLFEEILRGLEKVSGVAAPKMRLPHAVLIVFATLQELMGRLFSMNVLITREGVRMMHAKLKVTSQKAQSELGANFRPLEDTLRDVVTWYREHPEVV